MNDDENDLDVTQDGGQFSQAAEKAQNVAQTTKNVNSQFVKAAKDKIKKSESAKLKKLLDLSSKIMPKLIAVLPYIVFAVVIIIIIVGMLAFLVTMPGMITGKLKEFANKITDWFESLIYGNIDAKVNEEDILDTANYIKSMGYDLIGYGFIPANKTAKSISDLIDEGYADDNSDGIYEKSGVAYSGTYIGEDGYLYSGTTGLKAKGEGAGSYVDEYGISYETSGNEGGAPGTFETSGNITDFSSSTDTSLIRNYLMTDMKAYIARNLDRSDISKVIIEALINGISGFSAGMSGAGVTPSYVTFEDNKWAYGLISLYNSVGGIAEDEYTLKQLGDIKINGNNKTMTIRGAGDSNSITYSMDGWTGRYGMSLEFLLSLHLATMAPDLVETITRTYNTDIQVYLDSIADKNDVAMITGYFRTDSGEYITLDQLNQITGNDGVISNADAFAAMKEFGIDSKKYGIFACEYNAENKVLYVNDKEDPDVSYQSLMNKKDNFFIENIIKGKGDGGEEEDPEVKGWEKWENVQNADSSKVNYEELNKIIGFMNDITNNIKTNYGAEYEDVKSYTPITEIAGLENIITFKDFIKEVKSVQAKAITIYEVAHKSDKSSNGNIKVDLLIYRTSSDNNWDMAVTAYQLVSEKQKAEKGNEVCSDHFEDGSITKACGKCEDYVETIRDALKQTNDKKFKGKVPYIARVLESWFRDTYFVIPTDEGAKEDVAIKNAYKENDENYGHGNIYGTDEGKIKLSGEDIQLIEIDSEYKEQTDEYWTKYELNDDGTYRLYVLSTNGQYATDLNDSAITTEAEDKCEKDDKGFVYYTGSTKQAEEEGVKVVKKPILREDWVKPSGDLLWSAYNYNATTSNEMLPLEVNVDSDEDIKNVSLTEYDTYEERIYYSLNSVRTVMQIEDGQRGITNSTIKKMFKHRKYYMYDGTAARAEAIYEDLHKVLKDNNWTKSELEKYLDDFYYNDDTSQFTEDPRNPDLIGNIDINTESLNAFSILENIHTLDADYTYRDFKELVVELNYFDKEDLSGKVARVFSWILPEMKTTWPIRFIDKSEDYYGTYIHSNEALNNIKDNYGISEDADGNVQVTSDQISEEDAKTLNSAKGYEYTSEVISPVTGQVVGYGTYERINTDLMKYEGATEEEATEKVGYIQIKIMDGDYFEESWVPGTTDVGVKDEDDSTKYSNAEALNAFYEEYQNICEGYIVTIDGIELLDGVLDIDDLKALSVDDFKITDSFKPNKTANLVDDELEKKNQQKENAKAKAPAAVKNGDNLYIREGTVIGYTIKNDNAKGKDYSYTRVILRNEDRALRENVENYFDFPEGLNSSLKGTEFNGSLTEEGYRWLAETLEGADWDATKFIAEDLGDGTITVGPGITSACNALFEEFGYAKLAVGNEYTREELLDVYEARIGQDIAAIEQQFNGITFSENEMTALVATRYQRGKIPEQLANEIKLYKSGMANNLESVWTEVPANFDADFPGVKKRREAEYKLFTTGNYVAPY